MDGRRQVWVWGGFLLLFVAIFWALGGVIAPFLAGMAVAYFFDPLADRLERAGLSRLLATAVITSMLIAFFVLLIALIGPTLVAQVTGLIESVPGWFSSLRRWATPLLERAGLSPQIVDAVSSVTGGAAAAGGSGAAAAPAAPAPDMSAASGVLDVAAKGAAQFIGTLVSGGAAVAGLVVNLGVALVVAFYMLLDWDRMTQAVDGWLPRDHAPVIRRLAGEVDRTLAGFVRGQLLVCLILGSFYAVALTVVGLNYGLLIGLFAGMVSFIPFVGSAMGFLLSMGVALTQFWGEWGMLAAVAAVFLTGQFVEGNFLSPQLVGGKVNLHPVMLIFALTAFGSLFGFAGMLVAVPIAASIGVLTRYALERYFESPLYKGAAPDAQAQADAAAMIAAVTLNPEKAEAASVVAAVMSDAAREARAEPAAPELPPLPPRAAVEQSDENVIRSS